MKPRLLVSILVAGGLGLPAATAGLGPIVNENADLVASDGAAGDWFGDSVAIEGDRLVVGARMDDDLGDGSGSVYVFERDAAGRWVESAKVTASDGQLQDQFGAVALSGDTMVVGAEFQDQAGFQAGAAYLFERSQDGTWIEAAKLLPADLEEGDNLGEAVAIDGSIVAVGGHLHDAIPDKGGGAVWIYERTEAGSWVETAKLLASDIDAFDGFGRALAIRGKTLLVGAPGASDYGVSSGAAYVFERAIDGIWTESAKLLASDGRAGDLFGMPVATDGDWAAVGATNRDDLGPSSGAAYVFQRDEAGRWLQTAKLLSPDGRGFDGFGWVALDGDTLVVGSNRGRTEPGVNSGTADVYRLESSTTWAHVARLFPSDGRNLDQFGLRTAIDGDTVAIGARLHDDLGQDSGSVYVYSLEASLLRLRVEPRAVVAGGEVRVGIGLDGRSRRSSRASVRLWIEDATGAVIAGRTTPSSFAAGDRRRYETVLEIPRETVPGDYLVLAGLVDDGRVLAAAVEPLRVESWRGRRPRR